MKYKLFLIILSLMFQEVALAETTSSTKSTATLASSCRFTVDDISFGDITPQNTTDIGWTSTSSVTGSLNLTCTNKTSYSIALNIGTHSTDGVSRYLSNNDNSNLISYTICQTNSFVLGSSTCSKTWKTWSSGNLTLSGTGNGGSQTVPMYAFFKKGFNTPGNYSDTLTVTVSY